MGQILLFDILEAQTYPGLPDAYIYLCKNLDLFHMYTLCMNAWAYFKWIHTYKQPGSTRSVRICMNTQTA